jgi:hypothetical protein
MRPSISGNGYDDHIPETQYSVIKKYHCNKSDTKNTFKSKSGVMQAKETSRANGSIFIQGFHHDKRIILCKYTLRMPHIVILLN